MVPALFLFALCSVLLFVTHRHVSAISLKYIQGVQAAESSPDQNSRWIGAGESGTYEVELEIEGLWGSVPTYTIESSSSSLQIDDEHHRLSVTTNLEETTSVEINVSAGRKTITEMLYAVALQDIYTVKNLYIDWGTNVRREWDTGSLWVEKGKDATFTVTVHSIGSWGIETPEITCQNDDAVFLVNTPQMELLDKSNSLDDYIPTPSGKMVHTRTYTGTITASAGTAPDTLIISAGKNKEIREIVYSVAEEDMFKATNISLSAGSNIYKYEETSSIPFTSTKYTACTINVDVTGEGEWGKGLGISYDVSGDGLSFDGGSVLEGGYNFKIDGEGTATVTVSSGSCSDTIQIGIVDDTSLSDVKRVDFDLTYQPAFEIDWKAVYIPLNEKLSDYYDITAENFVDAKGLSITSSDSKVLKVGSDDKHTISAVGTGTATIELSYTDSYGKNKTASETFTVFNTIEGSFTVTKTNSELYTVTVTSSPNPNPAQYYNIDDFALEAERSINWYENSEGNSYVTFETYSYTQCLKLLLYACTEDGDFDPTTDIADYCIYRIN